MVILIASTTICHGADRAVDKSAGPEGLTVGGDGVPQISRPIRAAAAIPLARGGLLASVAFSVNRLCASAAAASTFAADHPFTCPRDGTLTLGSKTLANAHIDTILCRQQGISVHIDYRITASGAAPT